MKLRSPDIIALYAEQDMHSAEEPSVRLGDAKAWTVFEDGRLTVCLTANETPVTYVRLRWNFREDERRNESVRIMGDAWERGYGELEWRGVIAQRCMPWMFAVSNGSDADPDTEGRFTECFSVKVRPAALCFWQYDTQGITLWLDVRNGGCGVLLGGRELNVCEVVFREYRNSTAFRACHRFCAALCDDARFADHKIYGSNNWYYAYGDSSHEEILSDTALVAKLCEGNENRPYMVIDDGWQPNPCDGPWHCGNERFPDMAALAEGMKQAGVRPGIWIRYLNDSERQTEGILPEHRMPNDNKYLDPSHPDILALVTRDTKRIVNWGYQLIKHDFSTYDIFATWGSQRAQSITDNGWHFYDRTKTSAEIVVNLYRTIREAAGDGVLILGCNVIGHLAAGLVELNRTGDDTSGREWERTRKYGVNTLAFRMMHNDTFYAADADCVGITGAIDWKLNREWLRALSVSGSPLFVSCKPGVLSESELDELRQAFARNSVQNDTLEPIDWMENTCPERWLLNGEEIRFNWYPECGAESFNPAK